ncbi:hypothetical protein GGR50DRAFT_691461 [Xylaria sp. CBS 124048]|nr:hypothetical protein GGR50DRAFT_691461 [Xylaria sp. CBS 124048]
MNLVSQPGLRTLVLLLAIVTLYVTYGFFHFYRDPLSIFFSEGHGYDAFYSATRYAEAHAFLDAFERDPEPMRSKLVNVKAGPNPQMCAVFLTIGREMEGRQYVDTAVGSFLANMSRAEREAIHLKLFFADVPNPRAQHKSYASLVDIADHILTYPESLPAKDKGRKMALLESWGKDRFDKNAIERKTVHDYAYALAQCVQTTNAPYIALFEDDILLADGWAAQTLKNLQTAEEMMKDPRRHSPATGKVEPGGPNTWLYLRMFNQERSFGWGGGYGFRSNNAHIISLAVSIPLLAILLVARRLSRSRWLLRHLDGWVLFIVCGIAVPLFVWLFFASGKASLLGSPLGVHEEWFGCCNQALVYNRQHAQALSDFLMTAATTAGKRAGRGDMLPKKFAWDHGLARLSAYPMMAQHLGRISAKDTNSVEARRIWSMAFEDLNPQRLAHDHIRNVMELFGGKAAEELIANS